jgi:hypothetical protein
MNTVLKAYVEAQKDLAPTLDPDGWSSKLVHLRDVDWNAEE